MPTRNRMDLTEELVALVERIEPDPGPLPGIADPTEDDYLNTAATLLAQHRPAPLWLFAYGSLIWKPEVEHLSHVPATAHGWHRRFCMQITRWRGTLEVPGLMMQLDRGGSCAGVAYRLPDEDHHGQIVRLLRRELDGNPATNVPRWIEVASPDGPVTALTFVAAPGGPRYAGRLPLQEVARTLARAAGHWGSTAAYLYNTVLKLEEHGIRDRNLWALQAMVAEEIRRLRFAAAA
ncbi:MAG TPA: gamma-glutamylcyclotransferase [Devosiaceae bacterium]|jgi:cation transport protein ChaC|nr:gamma-glutamylcyclotransferase [Devosiaceae bacterium]